MKGRAHAYSAAEIAWIEARKDWPRKQLHHEFVDTFGRAEIACDSLKQFCLRRGWKTGRDGRIKPGNISHNKGKKMPFNPNSAATQFKKGQLPHNTNFIGHERINVDGYVEISVAQTNPHTGADRRYVHKHRYLWEQANGPIPDGHVLKCLGEKSNPDPENWELVPRAILPRLNGRFGRNYDTAPAQVKPTIMAVAKLEHRARELKGKRHG